jgi:hypothetical protein
MQPSVAEPARAQFDRVAETADLTMASSSPPSMLHGLTATALSTSLGTNRSALSDRRG